MTELKIVPNRSYEVLHNCAGCGQKRHFVNTGRFRVNANGSRLDVWLIYQCGDCKHTLNIPIYERIEKRKMQPEEYRCFLDNDGTLAQRYGMDAAFFKKNRLEVDSEHFTYDLVRITPLESASHRADIVVIYNPYKLRLRPEKIAGIVFNIPRSAAKRMMESGQIAVEHRAEELVIKICQKDTEKTY